MTEAPLSPAAAVEAIFWPPGARVGVACSGGLDSVVLLDLIHQRLQSSSVPLLVVHVDHGLRPGALEDARFVAELATQRALPCEMARLQLADRSGPGLEARARQGRYEAFANIARAHGLSHLCLAHHRDDQVETVVMRALRSSGPRGLRGIPGDRLLIPDCTLLRPLLASTRGQLQSEAAARGLEWREDPSNRDHAFLRNRVRHRLIPLLSQGTGFRTDRLLALARLAGRVHRDLERWADSAGSHLVRHRARGLFILAADLAAAIPDALCHYLFRPFIEALVPHRPFGKRGLEQLLPVVRAQNSFDAATIQNDILALRQGTDLVLMVRQPAAEPQPLDEANPVELAAIGGCLGLERIRGATAVRSALESTRADRFAAVLSAKSLKPPLVLQGRRPGMRYRPLGAPGRKLVADLMAESGVPSFLRDRMPVIADAAGPLWAPPAPPADRARIDDATVEATLITWRSAPAAILHRRRQ